METKLWRLFKEGLWLGSTVFGGAPQAYLVIRDGGWLRAKEVDGLYAVSTLLPGPSFLNLWGAVAGRVAGFTGVVVGEVGVILPTFVLVLTLPLLGQVDWIAAHKTGIMAGATWGTAGLLLATGLESLRKIKSPLQGGVAIGGLALLILGMHPLAVMLLSLLTGVVAAVAGPGGRRPGGERTPDPRGGRRPGSEGLNQGRQPDSAMRGV